MFEVNSVCKSLKDMLINKGFDFAKPDAKLCYEVFKDFNHNLCAYKFADKLLVQSGICNFECEELFFNEFAIIFRIKSGENEVLQKAGIRIYYAPKRELNELVIKRYSNEFDSVQKFYDYIEMAKEFRLPLKFIPLSAEIIQEEI